MSDWLETIIPLFAITFSATYVIWNIIRRKKLSNSILIKIFSEINITNLFRENKWTLILLFSGTLIALIYGLRPSTYHFVFLPIEALDRPLINYTGLLMLKLSMMLLFIVNIQCDLSMMDKTEQSSFTPFVLRINKMLTVSVAFMLIGLFITISSIGTMMIAVAAFLHTRRIILKN